MSSRTSSPNLESVSLERNKRRNRNRRKDGNHNRGMSGLCHRERGQEEREEGTYFSKSGAKSAALDSLAKPVTYRVFLGIWNGERMEIFAGKV